MCGMLALGGSHGRLLVESAAGRVRRVLLALT